jgi:hypothetical protein
MRGAPYTPRHGGAGPHSPRQGGPPKTRYPVPGAEVKALWLLSSAPQNPQRLAYSRSDSMVLRRMVTSMARSSSSTSSLYWVPMSVIT